MAREETETRMSHLNVFSYPDEDEENRYMWRCGIVTRVKRRDDKMMKLDIKWEEYFIA